MATTPAALAVIATAIVAAGPALGLPPTPVRRQVLPPVPGYIPVYIQHGDVAPEDTVELADLFRVAGDNLPPADVVSDALFGTATLPPPSSSNGTTEAGSTSVSGNTSSQSASTKPTAVQDSKQPSSVDTDTKLEPATSEHGTSVTATSGMAQSQSASTKPTAVQDSKQPSSVDTDTKLEPATSEHGTSVTATSGMAQSQSASTKPTTVQDSKQPSSVDTDSKLEPATSENGTSVTATSGMAQSASTKPTAVQDSKQPSSLDTDTKLEPATSEHGTSVTATSGMAHSDSDNAVGDPAVQTDGDKSEMHEVINLEPFPDKVEIGADKLIEMINASKMDAEESQSNNAEQTSPAYEGSTDSEMATTEETTSAK